MILVAFRKGACQDLLLTETYFDVDWTLTLNGQCQSIQSGRLTSKSSDSNMRLRKSLTVASLFSSLEHQLNSSRINSGSIVLLDAEESSQKHGAFSNAATKVSLVAATFHIARFPSSSSRIKPPSPFFYRTKSDIEQIFVKFFCSKRHSATPITSLPKLTGSGFFNMKGSWASRKESLIRSTSPWSTPS